MLSKLITTAIIVTLIAAVPAWYFSSLDFTLSSTNLPYFLVFIFMVSLISVWLGGRNNAPARKRSRNDSYRDNSQRSIGSSRESGSVKWFNASKGFGFITRDSGDDIFVHFRSIRGEGHRVLRDGQRVEFAVSEGDKGLQADDVVPAR